MRVSRWWRLLVCIAVLGSLLTSGCSTGNSDLPETRVLFIGNSFTHFNLGIDQVLHGLAPHTTVERAAPGGFSLKQHLGDADTMGKLRQGNWTYVVIQEQSQYPVIASNLYTSALRTLVAEVRAVGATPVLLMTWARPDDPRVSTKAISGAVRAAGVGVKAAVIPAGLAFEASLKEHPGIELTLPDGHPTPDGTYLAACLVYAELFGQSPEGNTYLGGVDAGRAQVLQATAEKSARSS